MGMRRAWVGMLIAFTMLAMGCDQDISRARIEMSPKEGCAPLDVSFAGVVTARAGVEVTYRWRVNDEILPNSDRVQYTFRQAGDYDIELTVASEREKRTQTAVLKVSEAALPNEPGVYRRLDCGYQALDEGSEQAQTVSLGKTSLEDLEIIMGRKLSTAELVTHPLWRREHTHTTYTIERSQFSDMALAHFQQFGFITVGETFGEAALLKLAPNPEPQPPAPKPTAKVVTRMIDSWDKESVAPEAQALERAELTPEILRYVPSAALTAGLYLISVAPGEGEPPAVRPIALVPADR